MGVNVLENNPGGAAVLPAAAAPQAATSVASIAARLAADANRIEYETDGAGRRIGVRKLNFLDVFDLSSWLGERDASNSATMTLASAARSVCDIDGEKVIVQSMLELRALMQRLDNHGIAAAIAALARFGGSVDASQEAVKN